ncbi:hypothetical protein EDB89DRAFT_1848422 [Lactarius sanguifluus]|nr:hypothetical protein EDB89DRAFT_1848422 [Lactarius sanguifluus]
MVEIYLNFEGSRFSFLSIPLSDVQGLSIRPFKWLRYVTYSIRGARGDLYATPDGLLVDYDSTELVDDITYCYEPSGEVSFCMWDRRSPPISPGTCVFVDYEGLNDKLTSTDLTPLATSLAKIRRINATENGVLLRSDLHRQLGTGEVAFLKTPNYGLDPKDIPRIEPSDREGPVPTDLFTLHYLAASPGYNPVTADILANAGKLRHDDDWVILDYVYGIATYKQWNSRRHHRAVRGVMGTYCNENYIDIPVTPPSPPTDNYEGPSDESDDEVADPTYVPGNPVDCHDPNHTSSRYTTGDEMAEATNDLNAFLMFVRGITPEEAAKRREKRMEEEELKAQEAGRSKVMEWMSTSTDVGSSQRAASSGFGVLFPRICILIASTVVFLIRV